MPRRLTRRTRRIAAAAVAAGVVAGVFAFVLPKIADYRDVWDVVRALSWWQVLALIGVTLANLATYPPQSMIALPGLRFRQAFVVTQASTASTYVAPGGAAPGIAVSFAMLRAWGFRARPVALAVGVIGIWNQLVVFGFPVLALGLLTAEGGEHPLLTTVALVGVAVFGAVVAGFAVGLSSEPLARGVGDLAARAVSRAFAVVRRKPVRWDGASLVRFRSEAIGLLRGRWHTLTIATVAGHLTVFAVLVVSLRVLEVPSSDVTGVEAFAAWSIVRLFGSLPLTPGGVGIVELGLTSLLVGFGGGQPEVVATVLVYRFLTVLPTLVLGLLAAATWKRHHPAAVERAQPHG